MGRSQVTEAVKTAYRLILTDPCRFQGCLCAGVKYIQRCTTESQNHAVLTEWARVWNSGSLVHDTTRSESRVRDGAGVSPLSQHVLQQGMKSFLKIAIPRADWLNNSGGLPITSKDITRVLSDIIRDPMFQRAVGLSTNGDKCSSIQGERTYPTRPSFNLGRGRTIQKRKTWDRIQRRAKEDPEMSTRIREKLASQKGISSEDAIRVHTRNRKRQSGISGEEPGQTCSTPNRKQR